MTPHPIPRLKMCLPCTERSPIGERAPSPGENVMSEDEKYLELLAIFHFIVGGITALFACIPLIHVALGLAMLFGGFGMNGPPSWFGLIFVVVGGTIVACGWALAIAIVIAGRHLKTKTCRMYCLVVGALECMFMPFGTVLGVFTVIVLMRDSVKTLFAANE
jgi:hypothetical protein